MEKGNRHIKRCSLVARLPRRVIAFPPANRGKRQTGEKCNRAIRLMFKKAPAPFPELPTGRLRDPVKTPRETSGIFLHGSLRTRLVPPLTANPPLHQPLLIFPMLHTSGPSSNISRFPHIELTHEHFRVSYFGRKEEIC